MKLLRLARYYTVRGIRFLIDYFLNLLCWALSGKPKALPPVTNSILLEPAWKLAEKIRKKQISSEEVVQAYITRMKEVQPVINAIVDTRFDEAQREARAVDDFIKNGTKTEDEIKRDTPLLGVPFSCKEAIGLKGMSFVVGLYSRKGMKAEEDADAVKQIKAAGVIPVVSTNVCELCMGWETRNDIYGTSYNPYDTRRIVGGSTGGEGALIASAGSVIGIGSDVGGSIRIPAYMNGIFGHKPSPGVVSNSGQFPEFGENIEQFLSTGPLCRYASDLLPMLKVFSANNEKLQLDKPVNLRELKIYYMEDDGGNPFVTPVMPEIKSALKMVLRHFEDKYGVVSEKIDFKGLKDSCYLWLHQMNDGMKVHFAEELTGRNGKLNVPLEFLKLCFGQSKHTFNGLVVGLTSFWLPEFFPKKRRKEALKRIQALKKQFDDLLGDNCVFLYPSHPEVAPYHLTTTPKFYNVGYTAIFNILRLPVTQCPLGLRKGLPIGIQAVTGMYNDRLSIAVAIELEKAFGGWVCPSPVL